MYKVCPKCYGEELGDKWTTGRRLQQYCRECRWEAEPRIPKKRPIKNTKTCVVDDFPGWDYIIYDCYGHEITLSQSFDSKDEAVKAMKSNMKAQIKANSPGGPFTGVLFFTPSSIKIEGERFEEKDCT